LGFPVSCFCEPIITTWLWDHFFHYMSAELINKTKIDVPYCDPKGLMWLIHSFEVLNIIDHDMGPYFLCALIWFWRWQIPLCSSYCFFLIKDNTLKKLLKLKEFVPGYMRSSTLISCQSGRVWLREVSMLYVEHVNRDFCRWSDNTGP
jgi:hypothetical protein